MNIKDLIVPVSLALITTWAIQYFFFTPSVSIKEQQPYSFVAPKSANESKPLNTEIDFADAAKTSKTVLSVIEMPWAQLTFTSDGAALERLEYMRTINGSRQIMGALFPSGDQSKEQRTFLVALDQKTPYYYTLVDKKETDRGVELVYQSETDEALVQKTFVVFKDKNQVDMQLAITPKKAGLALQPRVFYDAPYMPILKGADSVAGMVIDGQGVFSKTSRASLEEGKGWFAPHIFGLDDRYFVHALVKDENQFVGRAYYAFPGKDQLQAVLEGPVVADQTTWNLSFYLGPKESHTMVAVDARLEQAMDYYGWFAPIAKLLLSILNWLYEYLGNYGLAIIVLTVLMKLILVPFTLRAEKGNKQRADLQKKLAYVQQKYKQDPQRLAQERADLIRKYGMPGLGGCIPVLLQLPMFFALSRVLANSIELYQAPMLWISDLSVSDPYYVLPILVTLSMLAQAAVMEPGQQISVAIMALVFGAVASSFSAGLALYIFISTLLGVAQIVATKMMSRN